MNLTEFLLARIAEEEELARRIDDTGWPRHIAVVPESDGVQASVSIGTYGPKDNFRVWQRDHATEFGWAIHESGGVVWDPTRAIAECEAKRRIVQELRNTMHRETFSGDQSRDVLQLLALPYADHPDYNPKWRL